MQVIRDPQQWVSRFRAGAVTQPERPVGRHPDAHALTIGVFDGVHVGHRLIIERVQALAGELGVLSALVTFDPHPARLLRPELAPPLLTGLDHKLELLEELGLDTVVVVPFDRDRSAESAEDFVHSVLIDCLNVKAVIVGQDFHFGKGRLGNVGLLAEMGRAYGFTVDGHSLVQRRDEQQADGAPRTISSTAIRQALNNGDVVAAADLLGRPHEVWGRVVTGDQRGRTIGVPTANVVVDPLFAIPADGVYAGWYLRPDGIAHRAAVNVGRRPTFYEHAEHSLVEAHLLHFDDDLYDEPARVRFVERLRGEKKFDGIDDLKAQLQTDIQAAQAILDRA